jgi:hypothetical protein
VLKQIAAAAPNAQPIAMASGVAGSDQVFLETARPLVSGDRMFAQEITY